MVKCMFRVVLFKVYGKVYGNFGYIHLTLTINNYRIVNNGNQELHSKFC